MWTVKSFLDVSKTPFHLHFSILCNPSEKMPPTFPFVCREGTGFPLCHWLKKKKKSAGAHSSLWRGPRCSLSQHFFLFSVLILFCLTWQSPGPPLKGAFDNTSRVQANGCHRPCQESNHAESSSDTLRTNSTILCSYYSNNFPLGVGRGWGCGCGCSIVIRLFTLAGDCVVWGDDGPSWEDWH